MCKANGCCTLSWPGSVVYVSISLVLAEIQRTNPDPGIIRPEDVVECAEAICALLFGASICALSQPTEVISLFLLLPYTHIWSADSRPAYSCQTSRTKC